MVLTFRANGKADTAWLIWAVDSKTATLHPFLLLSTLCLYSTPDGKSKNYNDARSTRAETVVQSKPPKQFSIHTGPRSWPSGPKPTTGKPMPDPHGAGGPKSTANKPMLDPHSTGDVLASLQHGGDGEWVTGGRWRTGPCTSSPTAAESSRGPRATTSNRRIVSMEVPGRQPSRPGR